MEAPDIDYEAQLLANSTITALIDMGDFAGGLLKYLRQHPIEKVTSTITALIDMGYVLTLAESYGIVDRIVDLLEEEEELRPGRNILFES